VIVHDPAVARSGQHARGRRVRARAMRRHERWWSRMVTGTPRRPKPTLPEGSADVRLLDRTAADAVATLRFAGREHRRADSGATSTPRPAVAQRMVLGPAGLDVLDLPCDNTP
jgi:hypothetical protein